MTIFIDHRGIFMDGNGRHHPELITSEVRHLQVDEDGFFYFEPGKQMMWFESQSKCAAYLRRRTRSLFVMNLALVAILVIGLILLVSRMVK